MILPTLIICAFVESAIFAYYCIAVLAPKLSRVVTFLIIFAVMGTVTSVMMVLVEHLYVLRMVVGLVTYILFMVFLFREAYWKRFAVLFSSYIIAIITEQASFFAISAYTSPFTDQSVFGISSEDYIYFLIMMAASFLMRFLIIKYIAIPLWLKRLRGEMDNGILVALFTVMFVITLALFSTIGYLNSNDETFIWFNTGVIVYLVCSATIMTIYIRVSIRQRKKELEEMYVREQLKLQIAHNNEIAERYNRLRKLRHDFNNHMQVIATLDNQGKHAELRDYADRLSREFMSTEGMVFSRNTAVDAVLFHKREMILTQGICSGFHVTLPKNCNIEAFDLCCIFSNLLDNAIAACANVQAEQEPFIELETKVDSGYYAIVMRNSYSGETEKPKKNGLDDSHSLGLKIIADIAKKYDGGTLFEPDGEVFVSVVSLLLRES